VLQHSGRIVAYAETGQSAAPKKLLPPGRRCALPFVRVPFRVRRRCPTLPSTTLSITCGTAADENCSRYKYSCSCQRKSPRAGQGTSSAHRRIARSRATSITVPPTGIGAGVSYERVRASSKLTDGEIVEYLSYLRAKDISEIVFPAPHLVSCLPTLMTTQSSTLQLWDGPMLSARLIGISLIRWSATTVGNVAF
jgi:hypothetical protein